MWLQTRASPARTSEGEGWRWEGRASEKFVCPSRFTRFSSTSPLIFHSFPFFSPPLPTPPLLSPPLPFPPFPSPALLFPPFYPPPALCTPSPSTQRWDRRLECTPSLSGETCSTEVRVREVHRKDDSKPICWVVACGLRVLTGARVSNSVFY